jgi:hypothetical protein
MCTSDWTTDLISGTKEQYISQFVPGSAEPGRFTAGPRHVYLSCLRLNCSKLYRGLTMRLTMGVIHYLYTVIYPWIC